jgi:hypothetical protein
MPYCSSRNPFTLETASGHVLSPPFRLAALFFIIKDCILKLFSLRGNQRVFRTAHPLCAPTGDSIHDLQFSLSRCFYRTTCRSTSGQNIQHSANKLFLTYVHLVDHSFIMKYASRPITPNQRSETPATRKEVMAGDSGFADKQDFSTRLNIEKENLDDEEGDSVLDSGSLVYVPCWPSLGPVWWRRPL